MIIALGGLPRSGKDTLANYLQDAYGFEKVAFADGVRDAVYTLNPMLLVDHGGDSEVEVTYYRDSVDEYGYEYTKENSPQLRGYLQRMGTDVGRNMFGENLWVEQAQKKIYAWTAKSVSVVVTDTRFVNELSMLQRMGAATVWVSRSGVKGSEHESDTALDKHDFDILLQNDGDLNHLETKAHILWTALQEGLSTEHA